MRYELSDHEWSVIRVMLPTKSRGNRCRPARHRRRQLELRLQLGLGKSSPGALAFCRPTGDPIPPNDLSRDWVRACKALGLPRVMFHALRHTHASALIAARVDIVKISRRLGHGSPAVTLSVYSHLFDTRDDAVAEAIDLAMGAAQEVH